MKNLLLIVSAALLLFAGCETKQPEPSLEPDKTTLAFDKDGNVVGERVVRVASTIDWLVRSDSEWCSVTPLSVRGSAEITVNVTSNSDFAARTATITLSGVGSTLTKTITVTQSANDYVIGVDPLELTFGFDAAPGAAGDRFTIIANADWTIEPKYPAGVEEWCSASALEGSGNATVIVAVETNTDPNRTREMEFVVTVGDKKSTVKVKQQNNPELGQSRITSFAVPDYELVGNIDEAAKTIGMDYTADYNDMVATVTTSTWARISPDPATPRSYNDPVEFTVTSYDGTSTSVYTAVRILPPKRPSGIRPGSEKLMWAKKLNDDIGLANNHMTTGIAVSGNYLVLNTRNAASTVLNKLTGEIHSSINLGASVTGSLVNYYNTSDDAGNILINSLMNAAPGVFKVWKLSGITGTPELLIEYNTAENMGRKLSIKGDVNGDAIITVGMNTWLSSKFARWKVTGGVLQSQTPEFITMTDVSWNNDHIDVIYTSGTDLNADYFTISYTSNAATWMNGMTHTSRAKLPSMDANYPSNAIDYKVFNGVPFILFNHANSANWGMADEVVLANASSVEGFTATHTAIPAVGGAVEWVQPGGVYGSWTMGVQNTNGTADVALNVSEDGYYLYVYFLFTNGQVACYRFDCISDFE